MIANEGRFTSRTTSEPIDFSQIQRDHMAKISFYPWAGLEGSQPITRDGNAQVIIALLLQKHEQGKLVTVSRFTFNTLSAKVSTGKPAQPQPATGVEFGF